MLIKLIKLISGSYLANIWLLIDSKIWILIHIFGLRNIYTFEPNNSLIMLISLMFNDAKPRLLIRIQAKFSFKSDFI